MQVPKPYYEMSLGCVMTSYHGLSLIRGPENPAFPAPVSGKPRAGAFVPMHVMGDCHDCPFLLRVKHMSMPEQM